MQIDELRSFPLTSQLGRVLSGRFRIDELLGTGSMGAVFQAWDTEGEKPCAVKLLLPDVAQRQMVPVRFLDEARLASQLCHPNIVEVWDHYQEPDGTLYMVMELLQGQDLYTLLQSQGSLPLEQALHIVKQVGNALHMVHLAGIVHRDIKPKNIFLIDGIDRSLPQTVKIIDFGLAKLLDQRKAPRRGSDGMLIGTPAYLPPEAWNGVSADVDARADQWALGAMTYLMLSGQLPYECDDEGGSMVSRGTLTPPTPLSELVRDIPSHVDYAVTRTLAKNKEHRFACILDFLRAIHNLPPAAEPWHSQTGAPGTALEFHPLAMPATAPCSVMSSAANPLLSTLVAEALAHRVPTAPSCLNEQCRPGISASSVTPIVAREAEKDSALPAPPDGNTIRGRRTAEGKCGYGLVASRRRQYSRYVIPTLSAAAALLVWSGIRFEHGSICSPAPSPPSISSAAESRSALGFCEQHLLSPDPPRLMPQSSSCLGDSAAAPGNRESRNAVSRLASH